jgi:outer membrane biosynthesis protein TonB
MASSSAYPIGEADALSARPHVPARQVVLSAAALWLCYFLLVTVRGMVVELGEFQELLWRRALVTLAGIVVTLLAWPLLRRFDGRGIGLRIGASLVIMLPAALALAVINQQAFASIEQRIMERKLNEEAAKEPGSARPTAPTDAGSPLPAPGQTTAAAPSGGIRMRHDLSGNVLVDLPDPVAPKASSPPPSPPEPPAAQVPPAPPPAPDFPLTVRRNADGSSEMIAPGGVIVRHNADGTAQVRAGRMTADVDGDDADDIARAIENARRQVGDGRAQGAEARRIASMERRKAMEEGRRIAAEERRKAFEEVRRELAEAGITVPPPPAPAAAMPAPPAPPAPTRAASAPASKPSPTAAATNRPAAPAHKPHAAATRTAPANRPSPSASAPPAAAASAVAPPPQPSAPPSASASAEPYEFAIVRNAMHEEGLWRQLTDVALGRYFLLIAWAALYLALGNGEMARAAEWREGEYRRAAKAAELRSLRYQVNPHFLFNTLNSLSALVMTGRGEQAERMIQTISSFYRHSLAADPTSDVPLADEIALQRHYLEIEAVRFPDRLRTEFDVPENLAQACVPGMILQPLVENSIKYAVSATTRPVTIRISAREADGLLVLTVADDGPGKASGNGGTGIGLANVRNRLAARFGDFAHVDSGPLPAGGYATVLTIPRVDGGNC